MLVLSRRRGESVVINGDIVVQIACIRGDRVWIGIDAPIEMPVRRQEVGDLTRAARSRDVAEAAAMDRLFG